MLSQEGIGINIIISVYNKVVFLTCCLESVLSQAFRDLQIIDDCSKAFLRVIIHFYKSRK